MLGTAKVIYPQSHRTAQIPANLADSGKLLLLGDVIFLLNHLVLTGRDIAATRQFYEQVLGMRTVSFGSGRKALRFDHQKISLHASGAEYSPPAGPGYSRFGRSQFLN